MEGMMEEKSLVCRKAKNFLPLDLMEHGRDEIKTGVKVLNVPVSSPTPTLQQINAGNLTTPKLVFREQSLVWHHIQRGRTNSGNKVSMSIAWKHVTGTPEPMHGLQDPETCPFLSRETQKL